MMSKVFRIKSLIGFILLPFLIACGPLIEFPGSGEAPRHFQLSPKDLALHATVLEDGEIVTIYMENISSSGVLKTTSILVHAGSNELQYYENALWVDRTPILVSRFLTEALSSGSGVRVVSADSIEIPAQYRLKIDLRDFSLATGGSPEVKINLSAMLVRNGPVEVMATKEFKVEKRIANDEMDNVVSGFNNAMDNVAQQIAIWVQNSLHHKTS